MDSSKIKKGLGRGLSSLIGETKVATNINKLLRCMRTLIWPEYILCILLYFD